METVKRVKKYTKRDDMFTKMSPGFVGKSESQSGWMKNSNIFHRVWDILA